MRHDLLVAALAGFLIFAAPAQAGRPTGDDEQNTLQTLLAANKNLTKQLEKNKQDEEAIAKANLALQGVTIVLEHAEEALKRTVNGLEDEVSKFQEKARATKNNGCPWGGRAEASYAKGCNDALARVDASFDELRAKGKGLPEFARALEDERTQLTKSTEDLTKKQKKNRSDQMILAAERADWLAKSRAFVFQSEAYERLKKMAPAAKICDELSFRSPEAAAGCLMRLWDGTR